MSREGKRIGRLLARLGFLQGAGDTFGFTFEGLESRALFSSGLGDVHFLPEPGVFRPPPLASLALDFAVSADQTTPAFVHGPIDGPFSPAWHGDGFSFSVDSVITNNAPQGLDQTAFATESDWSAGRAHLPFATTVELIGPSTSDFVAAGEAAGPIHSFFPNVDVGQDRSFNDVPYQGPHDGPWSPMTGQDGDMWSNSGSWNPSASVTQTVGGYSSGLRIHIDEAHATSFVGYVPPEGLTGPSGSEDEVPGPQSNSIPAMAPVMPQSPASSGPSGMGMTTGPAPALVPPPARAFGPALDLNGTFHLTPNAATAVQLVTLNPAVTTNVIRSGSISPVADVAVPAVALAPAPVGVAATGNPVAPADGRTVGPPNLIAILSLASDAAQSTGAATSNASTGVSLLASVSALPIWSHLSSLFSGTAGNDAPQVTAPLLTTLPGSILGLAPSSGIRVDSTGRAWEITAGICLGVALAGYWYSSASPVEQRTQALKAARLRRVRDGWQLIPCEE